jgi:hypothetical protein
MRLPVWAWLALLSSLATANALAATRPHYGGNLIVELSAPWTTLDPAQWNTALAIPITETLVRINSRGAVEPCLSVAWQHDPDFKRWRFSLRPKATFHDGQPLNGASAVPSLLGALKKRYADVSIQRAARRSSFNPSVAMPDLLAGSRRAGRHDLSHQRSESCDRNRTFPRHDLGAGPPVGGRGVRRLLERAAVSGFRRDRVWPRPRRTPTYSISPLAPRAAYFRKAPRRGRPCRVRWWP